MRLSLTPNKRQPNLCQPLTATHFQLKLGQAQNLPPHTLLPIPGMREASERGIGMTAMEEWVHTLGKTLEVNSQKDFGTTVSIKIPVCPI